ncbi:UDP-N-acetylmuramoyl-tripeptide--D-alanyl-D-alanine ligase [Intestinimonas butyriciproducens]|mgnify:CR=1 FL=1|uniref:UDP-N-acetylmuramoyl-tripeptide--D-alanyl-D-alanine ligase n=1 Tax=Intestinimonas butyriciproducens TaxID=1297617 RepID=A0A2U1BEE6_9FIRM|nr:UDP-N-acetylmuramoyl-tripeptide--D-alanyl-D-alanine ligase [Intestinimonas butyriciproducens]SCI63375.1 UDP-N-acetylmuramoyl-tripeptide--D-alanyl-D-alanine ligase [uncultured Clostridium sp.]MBU5229683.1 UDP-N-acetylmuramoyl-tripeptide--D-alanyl-D-alanine ligase [Intestinimonas butyriciproducens]MCI6364399.1 UDP-N-acetylmuramoyl-tripeptide--D-alanyl-D-alanine ligase [Intestinimonas butyriciproducens]MCR1905129.1 UDP-N-acetylmuramoyl-tripeptide--D-alanyl-D-alanine ligase [Intestinimonas butyr
MEPMTIREILEAVDGKLLGEFSDLDLTVKHVFTDSRNPDPGALFIPLVGERFDGHAFLNEALEGGAAGCFTQRERESYLPGKFYIKVGSTQKALRDLARHYKQKFRIPFVAVTGSVGKTTTKDMVAAVLGERFKVLKTEGNFNNEVGLPLTLLRLNSNHEICVVEMGMNHFGEIEYLSSIVEPDVAVITNIGDSHIENLGSRENILKAKCEIFSHMDPKKGYVILNGDDPLLEPLRASLPFQSVLVGTAEGLDYRATGVESDGEKSVRCHVRTPRSGFDVEIPALGNHMLYPTLTAAAVAEHFGMTGGEIARGVLRFAPTKMRMNILKRGDEITILNDAYNANPQSMRAAVEVLSKSGGDYKIAVLGDMFELGPFAPTLHAGVGAYLGKAGIDCLVAVGELARHIYDAAKDAMVPQVYWCETKEEAKPILAELVKPNSTILVKASRGMAFEELVDDLKRITKEP